MILSPRRKENKVNYDKNSTKHYDYLVECAKKAAAEEKENPCYTADLLYALCRYFTDCGKPAAHADALCKNLLSKIKDFDENAPESVRLFAKAARAIYAFYKISSDENAKKSAECIFHILVNGSEVSADKQNNPALKEEYCGAIYAVSELYKFDKDKAVDFAMKNLALLSDENYKFSSAICAVNGAIGLLNISQITPEPFQIVLFAAKKIAAENKNLDYTFNRSFIEEKPLADPAVTSLLMAFYTALYKRCGDRFYLYMARRIWFNGMQFFLRNGGFVGYNNPPVAPEGILSVATYEEKTLTPLFTEGLCTYEKDKELFAEYDAPVKKDPRGRYIVDDKVFARELGEYFGRDLIEIPSLLSFDEETAKGFKFRLLF